MGNIIIPKMFGQQPSGQFADGLVFYWRGIPAGNVVDESGYGNHGTITGATWVGDGLSFDGTSNTYVSWAAGSVLSNISAAYTMIFVFKLDDVLTWDGFFNRADSVTSINSQLEIYIQGFGELGHLVVTHNRETTMFVGQSDNRVFFAGERNTFAVTWNGSEWVFYFDGVPIPFSIEVGSAANPNTGDPVFFHGYGGGDAIDGVLYYEIIYDRALSASEIQQLTLNPNIPMQQPPIWLFKAPMVGVNPKGPLGHPLYGPFAGPIVC